VTLHGVNVVYKVPPYIPETEHFNPEISVTDEDIDDLVSWGINHVRLGVMWEAVETAPGVYNQTYLDQVERLVNKMGDAGITTLLDAHQDLLARQVCGEGMPIFYAQEVIDDGLECISKRADFFLKPILNAFGVCVSIEDYGYRKDENGLPLIEDCQQKYFASYYGTVESISLSRALYFNHLGLRDRFSDYWKVVSQRFYANPHVVGIDPINEPFPGWNSIIEFARMIL
jgi:endoglycosylceramidase